MTFLDYLDTDTGTVVFLALLALGVLCLSSRGLPLPTPLRRLWQRLVWQWYLWRGRRRGWW